jgi:hypothetical protein
MRRVFLSVYVLLTVRAWHARAYLYRLIDANDVTLATNVSMEKKPTAVHSMLLKIHRPAIMLTTIIGIVITDTRMSARLRDSNNHVDTFRLDPLLRSEMIQNDIFPTRAAAVMNTMMHASTIRSGVDV